MLLKVIKKETHCYWVQSNLLLGRAILLRVIVRTLTVMLLKVIVKP